MRSYGGWRERRGFGLAGLGGTQTTVALVAVVVLLALASVKPSLLVLMGLPLVATGALVAIRLRGESLAANIGRRTMWQVAIRRGWNRHRGLAQPGLPGVLSGITVIEAVSPDGQQSALAWDRSRATLTAIFAVEPMGADLVDTEEAEQWADRWRDWLTQLGYLPRLSHVAVVVTSGPAAGPASQERPGPGLVREVYQELAEGDGAYCETKTLVAVTVKTERRQSVEQAASGLLDLVGVLADSLEACAVSTRPVFDPQAMVAWTRSQFDPDITVGSRAWSDARPTATLEHWDTYQHDGWISAAYCWDEPPDERIPARSLAHLLGASPYYKRICLVYEPVPATQTARDVERQTQAARFRAQYRRRLGRDETARDRVDLDRAQATADDEAGGAGVVDVSLYAAITARTREDLRRHATDLENRAGQVRLRLRCNYGSQAAGFAATLGLGYLPAGAL